MLHKNRGGKHLLSYKPDELCKGVQLNSVQNANSVIFLNFKQSRIVSFPKATSAHSCSVDRKKKSNLQKNKTQLILCILTSA